MKIRRGQDVLLIGPRSYLIKCSGKFECKYGKTDLDRLIGKRFGRQVSIGKVKFTVVRPTVLDYLFKRAVRGPQVILPKDAAAIAAHTGAGRGWKVVDAGTGSGFLAMFLANLGCEVTTYEKRKDFFEKARKNIRGSGLKIRIVNKDVVKGIKERDVDLVTLDMKNPERAIPHAHKALKPGGWLAVFSMHAEEIREVIKAVKRPGFSEPKIVEVLERGWQVEIHGKKSFSRPKTHMLAHTGFLTFCRRL